VPVLADMLNEFDETFDVRLANPTNAVLGEADDSHVTIVDTPFGTGPHAIVYDPGCRTGVLGRNDDGSTGQLALPFIANFFGHNYSSLYVNNNGNVTFDGPLSAYNSSALNLAAEKMIAPFFSDVDTRGARSDVVTYGGASFDGHAAFCVLWAHVGVGYYPAIDSALNSFQLLLVDRSDVAPGAFDIVFDYDQIQWDSPGTSGGRAARIGYSNGAGTSYELPGSGGSPGSLLDTNGSGLIHGSLNSGHDGRYIFPVRNGIVQTPPT